MVERLVYFVVTCINMVPRPYQYMSPRVEFTVRKVDFKLDCQLEFGEYVQVSDDNDTTNTMASRTTGAICMGPVGNLQGTYKFMSLVTWKILKRRSWVPLPLSNEIIDHINNQSKAEQSKLRPASKQKNTHTRQVAETNERRNGNHRHLNIPLLQDIPPTPPDEVEEVLTLPPPTNPPPGLTHPPAESQTPISNIAQVEANVAAALLTQSTEVIQNVATRQYTSVRQMQRTIETEIN